MRYCIVLWIIPNCEIQHLRACDYITHFRERLKKRGYESSYKSYFLILTIPSERSFAVIPFPDSAIRWSGNTSCTKFWEVSKHKAIPSVEEWFKSSWSGNTSCTSFREVFKHWQLKVWRLSNLWQGTWVPAIKRSAGAIPLKFRRWL